MITSRITNIVLEIDRIRVFLQLSNDKVEDKLFLPSDTSIEILQWKQEREDYYNDLVKKVEDLCNELMPE